MTQYEHEELVAAIRSIAYGTRGPTGLEAVAVALSPSTEESVSASIRHLTDSIERSNSSLDGIAQAIEKLAGVFDHHLARFQL